MNLLNVAVLAIGSAIGSKHLAKILTTNVDELILQASDALQREGQQSLEKFVHSYSQKTDEFIINVCQKEQLNYVGGLFILRKTDQNKMQIELDLYFSAKHSSDKIINKKTKTELDMNLYLNDEAQREIHQQQEIQLDIESPF